MKHTWRLLFVALLPGLLATSAPGRERDTRSWLDAQRISYFNAPALRKAEIALQAGDPAAAEPLLRAALVHDPGNENTQRRMADVCARLGKWEDAARVHEQLARRYPDAPGVQFKWGQAAGHIGRTECAVAAYEAVLRKAPADYPGRRAAIRELARLNLALGRNEQAERHGLLWSGFQPDAEPLLFLADCAVRRQDWTSAITFCDRLLKLPIAGTNRGGVLLQKGFALGQLDRRTDANAALREAETLLAGRGQRLSILRQLGFNALKEKQAGEAARCFKLYLLQEFEPAIALAHLDALARAGQGEMAALEARALLARTDLPPACRESAQRALAAVRPHPGAETQAVASHPLTNATPAVHPPPSLKTLVQQGVAAFRAGHFADAADQFTRALQLNPGQYGLLYLRGQAWFKQQRFPQAEADFRQFQQQADAAGGLPRSIWADLGVLEDELRAFDLGPAAPR